MGEVTAAQAAEYQRVAKRFGGQYVNGSFVFEPSRPYVEEEDDYPRVYFVGGEVGHIKIGYSICPSVRLLGLQTASPIELRLLAVVAGDRELEKHYHRKFSASRVRGEWFERTPELLAEIERLTTPAQIERIEAETPTP